LKIDKGCVVTQGQSNKEVADFICDELGLKYYWKGNNHIESTDTSILNLWRVVREEADLYTKRVEEYFKNNYFRNKDLSAISISMVEAFYNISDHAKAGENAFSLIMYNHKRKELKVAISDWGKGIVGTVREFDPSIKSDKEALERAIQDDFTISSTTHNKGKGLSNILSCSDVVRIFTGNALLLKSSEQLKIFEAGFYYPGTLIYFDKDLNKLEDIDYLDDFNW
jgi:anti-sigma regulatory factor (Ser/Thr protein kinase)